MLKLTLMFIFFNQVVLFLQRTFVNAFVLGKNMAFWVLFAQFECLLMGKILLLLYVGLLKVLSGVLPFNFSQNGFKFFIILVLLIWISCESTLIIPFQNIRIRNVIHLILVYFCSMILFWFHLIQSIKLFSADFLNWVTQNIRISIFIVWRSSVGYFGHITVDMLFMGFSSLINTASLILPEGICMCEWLRMILLFFIFFV